MAAESTTVFAPEFSSIPARIRDFCAIKRSPQQRARTIAAIDWDLGKIEMRLSRKGKLTDDLRSQAKNLRTLLHMAADELA